MVFAGFTNSLTRRLYTNRLEELRATPPVRLRSAPWQNPAESVWKRWKFRTEIFAGVTGNFALQTMALGRVFIAGGIAAKILPKLQEAGFFKSFCGAGKLAEVMRGFHCSLW